jgi:hypothetical protein
MKIAHPIMALSFLLAWNAASVHRDDVVVAQSAGNRTISGEFIVDPPTLINLGFEWFIQGDDNRNASVAVAYRKQGAAQWNAALPLLRLQRERISANERMDVISPNMFAGSILDLEPGTAYEVRLTLSDPDGLSGETTKNVTVRTRPEPMPHAGGRVFHVYPPGFSGAKLEPSFEGLMCAYNLTCAGTDWATAGRPRVKAGDTILVHAGLYKYNRHEYTNNAAVNRTQPLDGTYYLTADGTPDMPIAIKAAGDGEAIFDGNGNFAVFDVRAGDYTYIEGLTIRNAEYGVLAGTQFLLGAKGLTVKRSRFEQVGSGIFTNWSGSSNFYIADSTFIGRNDPDHVIGWSGEFWAPFHGVAGQTFPPVMASYVAIKLYGPGHVVAYNYVANFHDGVNVEVYGNPDGSAAIDGPKYPTREYFDRRPVAIDFYNNYMTNFHDNPFETDGGMHNIRVMRNMMINSASHAFCNQPAVGGPVYWIRNIAYHLPGGSSRLTGGAAGVLLYNNTILSETSANGTSTHTLAEQSVSGPELSPCHLQREHVHKLHLIRLQRLSSQPRSRDLIPMELAAVHGRCRFRGAYRRRPRRFAGSGWRPRRRGRLASGTAPVSNTGGLQPGDQPGSPQCARRLRHLCECAEARRAGSQNGAAGLQGGGCRLPIETRICCGGSRHATRGDYRWLQRDGARPGRA